ncbi:hypothetical protein WMY93_001951 [Mugilogobius chulae]|uniref:DUF6589 domain-containing protein n=1 Tax=Mugilogobius chulae TaxID=88201 RepID=A0AAW0PUC5_9GOBI
MKRRMWVANEPDKLCYVGYVPMGPGGISTVLVGGDRLTEGNSRNIQWAFADGATKEDRLEGMVFMFEDWHAIRNLLQIHYKIFFKKTSAKDHGTLFANMNTLRCSNAKQGPGPAYSAYKDVMKKDTTALFLAAAMEHFGLNDVTDNPSDFIPENVKTGTPEEKREWLHQKAADVVDTFVMQSHLMDTCNAATGNTDIICRKEGCGKLCKDKKDRENHEQKKHSLFTVSDSNIVAEEDYKKNHCEARLGLGFVILNMLDAVKEGDGERLFRLYKVALLLYKAYGHSQYAYSTFHTTSKLHIVTKDGT